MDSPSLNPIIKPRKNFILLRILVLTWDKEAVWWLALRCRRGEALE
jgi:hypothetical protein